MADGQSTTIPLIEIASQQPEARSKDFRQSKPQIFNMDVNYANQNKWFAYYPLEDALGKRFKNLNLHITRFSIPQLMQSSMEASFRGYTKEMPSKVLIPSTKEVVIEYIVDQNWENYRSLYGFMSNINGTLNPVSEDENKTITPVQYVPLRIYLLDAYKRKIIQFLFQNTWIKIFNSIDLDVNSPSEVHHSFTAVFESYTIEDVVS